MPAQVQELIDKIKSEGIEVAQKKAQEIETLAQKKAQEIIFIAQKSAEKLIFEANSEIKKSQEASQIAIKHAGRDTLLALHKEINRILNKIIVQSISAALTPEHLSQIISTAVKNYVDDPSTASIKVVLNPADLENLKNGYIEKLKIEIKRPIQFQSSDDIHKGFTISFDGGKSSFDFSDASLAEYLGSYVNEEVAAILKESSRS